MFYAVRVWDMVLNIMSHIRDFYEHPCIDAVFTSVIAVLHLAVVVYQLIKILFGARYTA